VSSYARFGGGTIRRVVHWGDGGGESSLSFPKRKGGQLEWTGKRNDPLKLGAEGKRNCVAAPKRRFKGVWGAARRDLLFAGA